MILKGLTGVVLGVLIAAIVLCFFWFAEYQCTSRWKGSGMATSWEPIKGCQIQHNGEWIPDGNYRGSHELDKLAKFFRKVGT